MKFYRGENRGFKHGYNCLPEYHAWKAMIRRCENKNCSSYKDYGGRGITVSTRWRDSFENFLSDIGKRPSSRHSLDRIDNSGNYEPKNCRWATSKQQSNNTRTNAYITINGQTKTLKQWCEYTNTKYNTVCRRRTRGVPKSEWFNKPWRVTKIRSSL